LACLPLHSSELNRPEIEGFGSSKGPDQPGAKSSFRVFYMTFRNNCISLENEAKENMLYTDLLTALYAAFNARDIEAALAAMHPDVDWPNGWEGGRIYGREAVREYWTRQWQAINPRVEPVKFDTDESGRISVGVHAVIRDLDGNMKKDEMIQHIYAVENGLIRSMEIRKPD